MIARLRHWCVALLTTPMCLLARVTWAQTLPAPAIELAAGWAAFPDESLIHHATLGAGARVHISPRVSLGPELTWMVGPGSDRDLFLLGNLFVDVGPLPRTAPPAATPYFVAGGGLFQNRNRFGRSPFTYSSFTFAGGGGVRVAITDRVYVAPDVRLAVEDLHLRATIAVGVRLGG